MEKIKQALHHTTRVVQQDVFFFRQTILQSEGGNLPLKIIKKPNLIKEIEEVISTINQRPVNFDRTK